jgi:hypothetical protein
MATIYRKSLKGIDEVAFKSGGLPLRLVSYLLAVDGEATDEVLSQRHPHLPSMAVVLQGLTEQGFLEILQVVPSAANVVEMAPARAANGAAATPMRQPAPQLPPRHPAAVQPPPAAAPYQAPRSDELELVKSNMIRDVSSLLGSDASMVISKIQACRTRDDLFAAMMGIKKIITMYLDKNAAEKFAMRYEQLAS